MEAKNQMFDEREVLHRLKHYLPAQAPLKDFVHHNTLQAFQVSKFHDGIRQASQIFGYKVSPSLEEYRSFFNAKKISPDILEKIIIAQKGFKNAAVWRDKALLKKFDDTSVPRVGRVKANWKKQYHIDLDAQVHPILFRILCSYLDQGIAVWSFPANGNGLLASLREMEKGSFSSIFKTRRARNLLLSEDTALTELLAMLVGEAALYEHYLFDQQFAHQGWSGMVSTLEDRHETLLIRKKISLYELVLLECLLEIDALDHSFGKNWQPLVSRMDSKPSELFAAVPETELNEVLKILQEALEWTYYDCVLAAIQKPRIEKRPVAGKSFQAMFCIDDREGSLRQYLEFTDDHCETFGTPGFFGVEFYYQPADGNFYTKVCPEPITPRYLIKEVGAIRKKSTNVHFSKLPFSFHSGWSISQTLGYWSAFKLAANIFKPSATTAVASSFTHMDRFSRLTIENQSTEHVENGLQIGFTVEEMATRVENLLRSIGLLKDFAPIVYVIGHGSSSVNNPHYAAYECGDCSGRAGSVNARVLSHMANHHGVRNILNTRGIGIPSTTQFVGGLHDTTRDEIVFYEEAALSPANFDRHDKNISVFDKALDLNAKERSRRFQSVDTSQSAENVHDKIRLRSISLFEPRPELNHATNALCIIGRRELSKNVFLDRRAFINSYDYAIDPEGKYLFDIIKTAVPVCGGINLEYYFSRVDNQKLGAGTKLPHNVMGLFGIANGYEGDLRPGLHSQMIEIHDPLRMLFIAEHFPDVLLDTIQRLDTTYEWFINEWVHLVAVHPETQELFEFKEGAFYPYKSYTDTIEADFDLSDLFITHPDNLPAYSLH
ncbi:hypothetical protein DYBT9275_03280 [Dyadobacter sp. CECT 9275]|uniref:Uncharacterized protein n=1 Tax=Dyadobacter helix TaxID=2822344 RepID=A0A916NCT9_9BACT|nr:DUF2309 domain-containing protein [Dyadobacter sp. CECT 9275]CAG5004013.1 hypothetical protein DYBT9275_03280 [Dyadobacter sp. CECT 9275]